MSKVLITDTILRDAHQSQAATRMRLDEMLPIYGYTRDEKSRVAVGNLGLPGEEDSCSYQGMQEIHKSSFVQTMRRHKQERAYNCALLGIQDLTVLPAKLHPILYFL